MTPRKTLKKKLGDLHTHVQATNDVFNAGLKARRVFNEYIRDKRSKKKIIKEGLDYGLSKWKNRKEDSSLYIFPKATPKPTSDLGGKKKSKKQKKRKTKRRRKSIKRR